jgi:pimeloyl-ACP methyl ester carboxylesterase
MATFLVCHGAWSGGWSWRKMREALGARGHQVWTPTYTGLGERAHLAHPLVDLDTHIRDVLAVIACEGLRDLVLVGHSYGGMVATGVADRAPEGTIRHLVYLDAFVPEDERSLASYAGEGRLSGAVEGWLIPPSPPPPDTAPEDLAWTAPRRRHQPAQTFSQPLRLTRTGLPPFPRTYIYCAQGGAGRVPPVRGPPARRPRVALPRNGREPQPEHHRARGADGGAARGGLRMTPPGPARWGARRPLRARHFRLTHGP